MNFRSIFFSIFLLSIFSCSTSPTVTELVGEWQGVGGEGKSFTYTFSEDGSLIIVEGTEVMDGKSVGGKLSWKFSDADRDPTGEYSTLEIKVDGTYLKKTKYKWIKAVSENEIEIGLGDKDTPLGSSFAILTRQ